MLYSRCDRCGLQPLSESGAAEELADGLSRELQTQLRMWGHGSRGRGDPALHTSLQVLTRKCLLLIAEISFWELCKFLWELSESKNFLFQQFIFCFKLQGIKHVHIMRLVGGFQQLPLWSTAILNSRMATPHYCILTIYFSSRPPPYPPKKWKPNLPLLSYDCSKFDGLHLIWLETTAGKKWKTTAKIIFLMTTIFILWWREWCWAICL